MILQLWIKLSLSIPLYNKCLKYRMVIKISYLTYLETPTRRRDNTTPKDNSANSDIYSEQSAIGRRVRFRNEISNISCNHRNYHRCHSHKCCYNFDLYCCKETFQVSEDLSRTPHIDSLKFWRHFLHPLVPPPTMFLFEGRSRFVLLSFPTNSISRK